MQLETSPPSQYSSADPVSEDTGPKGAPSRWTVAQQIGFGASLLALTRRPTRFQRLLVLRLLRDPVSFGDEDRESYVRRCFTLPPNVLAGLLALKPEALGKLGASHRGVWETAAARQHETRKQRSKLTGAKLIADRIFSGLLVPEQLVRIARVELGEKWLNVADCESALYRLMERLTAPTATAADKSHAIAEWGRCSQLIGWQLVENALMQLTFAWPLLVVELKERSPIDFSLPMGIDVLFDGGGIVRAPATGSFDVYDWLPSIERAKKAAQQLWLQKFGAAQKQAVAQVENSSIVANLDAANEIVSYFSAWTSHDAQRRELVFPGVGRSAEALFALTILQKYLGSTAMRTTTATGVLSKYYADPDGVGGDYGVDEPDHTQVKAATAAETHFFDRMIVPDGLYAKPIASSLLVLRAQQFSDFAESAFGQQFQRHTYIRCPDLALAFRPRGGRADGREVAHVLDSLDPKVGRGTSSVLDLADSVRPEDVVRALYRLNDTIREERREGRYSDFGRFVVIRCTPDERGVRFWRVVWENIAGIEEDFFDFQFRVDDDTAGRKLAEQMDAMADMRKRPGLPPDLVVLVGYEHVTENDQLGPLDPFRRHSIDTVLGSAQRYLKASRNPGLCEQVGRTRFILVRDPEGIRRWPTQDVSSLSGEMTRSVQTLGVFRHGFTFAMARDVLGVSDAECWEILGGLTRADSKGRRHLAYADRPREYFLLTQMNLGILTPRHAANLHERAADSISGFLSPATTESRSNFTEALRSDIVHETQWHLEQAKSILRDYVPETRQYLNPKHKLARLSRVAEPFGWGRLKWALGQSNEDREELLWALKRHLNERRQRGYPLPHPKELSLAAQYAFKTEQRKNRDGDPSEDDFPVGWQKLLKDGRAACRIVPLPPLELRNSALEIDVLDATYSLMEDPSAACSERLQRIVERMRAEVFANPDGLQQHLIEWIGDIHDTRPALNIYEAGLGHLFGADSDRQLRLVIKYLGTSRLADLRAKSWVVNQIRAHASELLEIHVPNRSGILRLPSVDERWTAGTAIFWAIVRKAGGRSR